MICYQCLLQSLIANWFKSWCFVVIPVHYLSREQDGCLRLSLLLNMNNLNQDGGQSSYVIIHDMWCQLWGGLRVHYRGSLGVRFILLILMILTSSSASSASHLILLVILILISILLSGVLYPPHTHHPPRPPSCTSQSRKKTDWFSPPAFVHPLHTSGVLLLSPWQHLAWAYLLNQRMNRIEQVFLSWQWLQNF